MTNQRSQEASVIGPPLRHCPTCGSDRLQSVVEARVEEVHFLCLGCGRCWDVSLGWASRVMPPTCFGCPERGRCELVYARDHPGASGSSTE